MKYLKNEKKVKHIDELGGHSSVFAQRAQKEQCNVFLAAQASDFNKASIPLKNSSLTKYLIWPTIHDSGKPDTNLDTHLVFEYNEGD